MSRALATQPSSSCRGQVGIAIGAFSNRCSNDTLFQSLPKKTFQRSVRLFVIAGSDRKSKSPSQGNEKPASRRLQVVSNATPTAVASATGLLIPLSIVDSDHEDFDEEKFVDTNLLNHLLVKKKKQASVKKKKAGRGVEPEAEGEISITSKSLDRGNGDAHAAESLSSSSPSNYDDTLVDLIDQLESIRLHALGLERWHAPQLKKVHRHYLASARNLLHYVAFRSLEVADLQERLASSGLASLEGCEAHTLASMNSISAILRALLHGSQMQALCEAAPLPAPSISQRHTKGAKAAASVISDEISFEAGNSMLSSHAEALLGPSPPGRKTMVMVTLPTEAAEDDALIRNLFISGMNVARINCAHDGPEVWKKMVQKVRFFSQLLETPCRISFDLAGPKLRTGPMRPGPSVLKIKPSKDSLGDVVAPACVWLAEEGVKPPETSSPHACIPVIATTPKWTKKIQVGDSVKFKDARGRSREFHVVETSKAGVFAECRTAAYIESGCELTFPSKKLKAHVGELPQVEQAIVLRTGDELLLKRDSILGSPAKLDKAGKIISPASVTCTLEKVFSIAKPGESVKFDDGKISGVISSVSPDEICVAITEAGHQGRKLRGEKAINFPESDLSINGLTLKDTSDLDFIVANADILALSFVNGPADVRALQQELARRPGAEKLGIVVKIETELGFQRLPSILLQAMETSSPIGVMVARGDMAVECGWQRLAEIQDHILLICESAHVPTIWATQVLEGMAKSGLPSRAEITDAASGSRAECVMLNKGAYILQAVASLDDILRREACHRRKNHTVLHPLENLGIMNPKPET